METAINIAYGSKVVDYIFFPFWHIYCWLMFYNLFIHLFTAACKLINNGMKQFVISSETEAIREVEDKASHTSHSCFFHQL